MYRPCKLIQNRSEVPKKRASSSAPQAGAHQPPLRASVGCMDVLPARTGQHVAAKAVGVPCSNGKSSGIPDAPCRTGMTWHGKWLQVR